MKQRGRFLYQDPDGTIFIKFEHPGKGVPIESLLPENGRGTGFAEFRIQDYFDLAYLVLAAPKEFAAFCRNMDLTGVTKENPKKVSPPAPSLDFLKLRSGDGMDAARSAELFEIVAAYWSAPQNTMALEPGLVATLWHSGMKAKDIIDYVKRFTTADGKLDLGGFKDERGYQILYAVTKAYKVVKGLDEDAVLLQSELGNILEIWLAATRAAAPGTPEISNSVLHWSDYRRLGLVDGKGAAHVGNVRRLAEYVISADPTPEFDRVEVWAEANLKVAHPKSGAATSAARALLKKQRKQRKLNRKRGRP